MQNLQHLINQLETKISQFETTNLAVSGESVGWHIEHSLKKDLSFQFFLSRRWKQNIV
jgi:hypothetical protein